MVTFRCTARLLRRMRAAPADITPRSTGRLGDWYATLLVARRQAILCMSESTLLPVVIEARDAKTFPQRLGPVLERELRRLGVDEAAIRDEVVAMDKVALAPTSDRRLLGSLMEFARLLSFALEDGDSFERATEFLARTPCRSGTKEPLFPDRATQALFGVTAPVVPRRP